MHCGFVSEYLVFEKIAGNLKGQRGLCLQPTLKQLRNNNNVCACMCFQTDLQCLNLRDLQEEGMVRILGVPREGVLQQTPHRWRKECTRPEGPETNAPLNQTNSSQPTWPGRTLPPSTQLEGRHGEEGHLGQISSGKPSPPHPPKPLRHAVVMPSRSPGYTRHQRLSGTF